MQHASTDLLPTDGTRRQALKTLSLALCGALAGVLTACAQGSNERWQPPDYWRSKRGSNSKGGDR